MPMNRRSSRALMRVFAVVLVLAASSSCNRGGGLSPGELAPDLSVKDLTGAERQLSEFRGSVVLLNFWATWCAECVREMPALQRLHDLRKDAGLKVVGLGINDRREALAKFREENRIGFPLLFDSTYRSAGRFKVEGVPESFVLDRAGKVVMIADPETGEPMVRIVGARAWDSPASLAMIDKVLATPAGAG